ncbi:hypothetical protein [Butyrivibrio sp. FCS014]|uniref:hypothetical protein n=1 Tax=Butyrivibrio sp. FCS014 TaxID=1408304 RepID=UPI0004651F33|nr:hypothetical protein [Butyrivibrio sp. FCS014]
MKTKREPGDDEKEGADEDSLGEDGEDELSSTGNEKKVTVKAAGENETGYSDSDVYNIAVYVQRYSALCGATKGAAATLGSTYEQISAMKKGLEAKLPGISTLVTGADAVASGTEQLKAGLGALKDGQIALSDGIGQVGAGVSALYQGADTLTANQ